MHYSDSYQSFKIETDEDDKAYEEGSDSESFNDTSENEEAGSHQRRGSILEPVWPQSYRQSMDLLGSLPSSYQGAISMSRLGSSFISSSILRKRTDDVLPFLNKPLIQTADEEKPASSFLQPTPNLGQPSFKKVVSDKKQSIMEEQEPPVFRQSSYGQAVINGMNVLCGVGILSTPYAVRQGGWLGISILLVYALLSFYTGILLRSCLDSQPGLQTYPDIGQAAFGTTGRIFVSIVLYVELYACSIEYLILESDNLSSLFPNVHLKLGLCELNSHILFALIVTFAVLPTVWLRDMSVLSYISAGGVLASILVVACLFWVGLVDHVNEHSKGATLNLSTLPVAIGLYGFCYSGHAVFPNIYSSMQNPSQYTAVLLTSFGICTLMYAAVAVMGYQMFGQSTQSQFTLNLPKEFLASKIAVWTTVVNPFTKCIDPVSSGNEPGGTDTPNKYQIFNIFDSHKDSIGDLYAACWPYHPILRSGFGTHWFFTYNASRKLSNLVNIPEYFALFLLFTLWVVRQTLILPCVCYLSILRGKISIFQRLACQLVIGIGVMSSALGTYSAISKIVDKMS